MSGLFLTFEGVEGCGKTTQMACLEESLRARGVQVVVTREPGGTPIAETIRNIILDTDNAGMADTTELLLYAAARAQHVAEKIRPALEAGRVVLCDRFYDSTSAYQGGGRKLSDDLLADLNRIATGGLTPHKTFLLDLPAEEGLRRIRARGDRDRIEQESLDFHEDVRRAYLKLAMAEPARIQVLDASRSVEASARDILAGVDELLSRH
jgi:dTMP kinase